MKKAISIALGVSLFAVAGVASAANFTNVEFENGDTEIQGRGGETVEATVRVTIPEGEVIEQFQWDVLGDGLAPKCEEVGGSRGLEEGTHFIDFDVKLPPNTGTYDLDVQGSGIYGGLQADDCEGDVVDDATFNDALRVSGSSSSNDDDDDDLGSDASIEDILKKLLGNDSATIALILKLLGQGQNEPAKPAYCSSFVAYNGTNTHAVQAWLANNGFMTWAAVSTGPGIYGPKTQAAYASASAQCN